jgi:hypothetical protein
LGSYGFFKPEVCDLQNPFFNACARFPRTRRFLLARPITLARAALSL